MLSALLRLEKAPGSVRTNTCSLVGHRKQISAAHPILIPLVLFVLCLVSSPSTQSLKIPLRHSVRTVKGGGHSLLNVEWDYLMVPDGLMAVNFHQSIASYSSDMRGKPLLNAVEASSWIRAEITGTTFKTQLQPLLKLVVSTGSS